MAVDPAMLLQRLRYWLGQALRSRDLNDQVAFDALLRAWHNRALHSPAGESVYGVREGLAAALDAAEEAVEVQPGLAYDARGRALPLPAPLRLALPPALPAGGLILMLCECGPVGGAAPNRPDAACLPGGGAARPSVRLCWVPAPEFDPGEGVALVTLLPGPRPRDTPWRVAVQPLARPRIGAGATIPGGTPWQPWRRELILDDVIRAPIDIIPQHWQPWRREPTLDDVSLGAVSRGRQARRTEAQLLGLQVDVDTAAAGFTATPCYLAWLEGDLWQPDLLDRVVQQYGELFQVKDPVLRLAIELLLPQLLMERFAHIYQPTATGFTCRVWLPQLPKYARNQSFNRALALVEQQLLLLAQQGKLAVVWVGLQEPFATPRAEYRTVRDGYGSA
jgi:hypothetical protein